MARIRRILVAIKEPHARSQPALRKAAQLAKASGARLELYHAITQPLSLDALALQGKTLAQMQREWRASEFRRLQKHAQGLADEGIQVDCACDWDFPAYEAIVRRSAHIKADLIVAERHAKKHIMPWLLRFNDWELLRRSLVPVLLVKRPQPWRRPVVMAAIDPQHSFAKPAQLDRDILEAGQQAAELLGGSLHVAHACPMPAVSSLSSTLGSLDMPSLERQGFVDARRAFNRELEDSSVPAARRHLVQGHPVDVIPKMARQLKASLVIMGGVSRSGLKRLVIGNVAEQVLDALPCDVLVLKPRNFKARVSGRKRGVQLVAQPPYV